MDCERLKREAKGRWLGVFESFGIDVGVGKHQPCPVCGGKDRFRFTDKHGNGNYFCNGCDPGDGFDLIMKYTGLSFSETIQKVSEIIGVVEMDDIKKTLKVDPKPVLNKVWGASSKLTGSDPVSKYLHLRSIVLTPDNVRYCPKCYESDSKAEVSAMVAKIQNRAGKPVSLHRTYLGLGMKKVMTPTEPLVGAAIRLFQPGGQFEDGVLGVAEGVETACSAAQLNGIATWAVISTSIMAGFEPPEGIRRIVIFADNDANFAGQKAAYTLANKLFLAGLLVEVEIPLAVGEDWNDVCVKLLYEGRQPKGEK